MSGINVGYREGSSSVAGLWIIEDLQSIRAGIAADNGWAVGLGGVALVADGFSMAINPLGELIGMGLSYVIEHIEPLAGWFDQLTGSYEDVLSMSERMSQVDADISQVSANLATVKNALNGQSGQAVSSLQAFIGDMEANVAGVSAAAGGMSQALQIGSTIVQMVHDLVRDALSEVVGTVIANIPALASAVGTIPALTAIGIKATSLATKCQRALEHVADVFQKLSRHFDDLMDALKHLGDILGGFVQGGSGAARRSADNVGQALTARFGATPAFAGGPMMFRNSDEGAKLLGGGLGSGARKTGTSLGSRTHPFVDGEQWIKVGRKKELKPDCWYRTGENSYLYKTDKAGRISEAHAEVLALPAGRFDRIKQKITNRLRNSRNTPGKIKGVDDAGHVFGDRFGGSAKIDNLTSQLSGLNRGDYKRLEDKWFKALKNGDDVQVKVKIDYAEDGLRPTQYSIDYAINGQWKQESFNNTLPIP